MFKKILGLVLVLALCFSLAACGGGDNVVSDVSQIVSQDVSSETASVETSSETSSADKEYYPKVPFVEGNTPLLYSVTDANGNIVWLFGSIHVGREEFYPFADYLYNAFEGSEVLAVEVDVLEVQEDAQAVIEALYGLLYLDGTTIKDHISEDLYNRAVAILTENGVYMSELDYYCPAFWSSTIDSFLYTKAEVDTSYGLDINLLYAAKELGKTVESIESAEFQYKMLAGFSEELQELLLEASVEQYENPDEAVKEMTELMDLWGSGDEEAFAEYLSAGDLEVTEEEKALYDEYMKALITDRNITMAEYAENALKSGKETFVCVGAAHVVGEGGIADLLEQKGYTVKLVTPQIH